MLQRAAAWGDPAVWIDLFSRDEVIAAAEHVARRKAAGEAMPLYGVPFAVKDNIDVAGHADHRRLPGLRLPPRAFGGGRAAAL